MKYSELTPEEINALAHGQVQLADTLWGTKRKDGTFDTSPAPNYLEDMNLCMGLVENTRYYEIVFSKDRNRALWECEIIGEEGYFRGIADTPQEAIIKAVLLAHGEIEEE